MKKLFIFDFDGTLYNTLDNLVYEMNKSLKIHNFPPLDKNEYKDAVGGNINQLISKVLGLNSTEENIEKVKETYLEFIQTEEDTRTRPFDGIKEMLTHLQDNNIQLAINSNRYTYSIEYYLKKHMNDIKFLDIQGHDPPNPSKPDAYGIFKIMEKTTVDKKDILYVGDSQTDIETALNADIDCIIVNWGYYDYDKIHGDNLLRIISKPDQLYELIEEEFGENIK